MENDSMIYVVTMYRYGDREKHSYDLGVWDDKEQAIKEAEEEQDFRGGNKYYPEVLEFVLNTKHNTFVLPLWSR